MQRFSADCGGDLTCRHHGKGAHISGAMRNCPTGVMEVLLELASLHFISEIVAERWGRRERESHRRKKERSA